MRQNMAGKRLNNEHPAKKQKVQDLSWDEDLDPDLLDDFEKQALEETQNPFLSYSRFEAQKSTITSTQMDLPWGAPLQSQIQHWQEKYKEKEGEVSILRTNLKQIQTSNQVEKDGRLKDLQKNVLKLQQEMKNKQGELEFKNLEVTNLQQQIADMKKLLLREHATTQVNISEKRTSLSNVTNSREQNSTPNYRINYTSEKYYPLKKVELSILCSSCVPETNVDKISARKIQSDILYLMNMTIEDFNGESARTSINYVCLFQLEMLKQLHSHLSRGSEFKIELCTNCLALLTEIIPLSNHLQKIIFNKYDEKFTRLVKQDTSILKYILQIMILMNKQKMIKENWRCELQVAVLNFAAVCFSIADTESQNFGVLENIMNELLDIEIDNNIILSMTILFQSVLKNKKISEDFCQKKQKEDKRLSVVTTDVCRFSKFTTSLINGISNLNNKEVLKVASNVLSAVNNLFETNVSWLYENDNYRCDCLSNLYKLSVNVIHSTVITHSSSESVPEDFEKFILRSIVVLDLLFNSSESMQKYKEVYRKCKHVVFILTQWCNSGYIKLESHYGIYLNNLDSKSDNTLDN